VLRAGPTIHTALLRYNKPIVAERPAAGAACARGAYPRTADSACLATRGGSALGVATRFAMAMVHWCTQHTSASSSQAGQQVL
jgi:hypothetical protein